MIFYPRLPHVYSPSVNTYTSILSSLMLDSQFTPTISPITPGLQCSVPQGHRASPPERQREGESGEPHRWHHILCVHVHHPRPVREGQAHLHLTSGLPGTPDTLAILTYIWHS